jgi:hypothetical protein
MLGAALQGRDKQRTSGCMLGHATSGVLLSDCADGKLQMEWSNRANDAGTGYLNRSGQPGCLQ